MQHPAVPMKYLLPFLFLASALANNECSNHPTGNGVIELIPSEMSPNGPFYTSFEQYGGLDSCLHSASSYPIICCVDSVAVKGPGLFGCRDPTALNFCPFCLFDNINSWNLPPPGIPPFPKNDTNTMWMSQCKYSFGGDLCDGVPHNACVDGGGLWLGGHSCQDVMAAVPEMFDGMTYEQLHEMGEMAYCDVGVSAPPVSVGCMDPKASNYDPDFNYEWAYDFPDSVSRHCGYSSCDDVPVEGCASKGGSHYKVMDKDECRQEELNQGGTLDDYIFCDGPCEPDNTGYVVNSSSNTATCAAGFFGVANASECGFSGCSLLTVCGAEEFESVAPTPTTNRECSVLTVCGAGEYESVVPSATSDRGCANLTVCGAGEFESVAPTATTDRECSVLTVCGAGEEETVPPTATTDRVCEAKGGIGVIVGASAGGVVLLGGVYLALRTPSRYTRLPRQDLQSV